jgi:fibronectin type 3 domain-containing protein
MAAQSNTWTTSKARGSAMKLKLNTMNLREFIKQHYTTIERCAVELDVSRRTIENYCFRNPSGILKHSGQIIQLDEVEPLQLFDAVAETIEQINKNIKQ